MSKFLTPPVWYDKNGNLNEMLTGEASGGGVAVGPATIAVSNGVAVGSNAQASGDASSGGVAIGSNADSGNGVAIGPNTVADSHGIAIEGTATGGGIAMRGTSTGGGIAMRGNVTGGGIAIGGAATGNGIAIGGNAAANNVQLGSTNTTYDLTVGNGTGTLNIGSIAGTPNIGSIKFNEMKIASNKVSISQSGVYLCCTTYKRNHQDATSTSNVAICFINAVNDPAAVLSSNNSCSYAPGTSAGSAGEIIPVDGFTIRYCFKIISL